MSRRHLVFVKISFTRYFPGISSFYNVPVFSLDSCLPASKIYLITLWLKIHVPGDAQDCMFDAFDLIQFHELQEACIDASSLLYLSKIGCLETLRRAIELYSIAEILDEAGMSHDGFHLIACRKSDLSNDLRLLNCAIDRQAPLISEDKQLLLQARRAKLPYYNSLMMLNFLVFAQLLDAGEYACCHRKLQHNARYSESVWQYGDAVLRQIHERSIKSES
ncbi:hypothetical protein CSB45_04635 [candidate division KSB3 bacterium]|uniref:PIN domain-containing protein n=1 Tax=candidate division KSB3 bacterium TaxID=2044937 RepID=A0A2G6E8D2_9BACT|nr:MAG: hypothetical protein CSB45_04635 [candidate division KSB3 bacterium]PIE30663.1 MAG: hypothetical protein CSA57_03220 [candidate division KSB3 bacterium]